MAGTASRERRLTPSPPTQRNNQRIQPIASEQPPGAEEPHTWSNAYAADWCPQSVRFARDKLGVLLESRCPSRAAASDRPDRRDAAARWMTCRRAANSILARSQNAAKPGVREVNCDQTPVRVGACPSADRTSPLRRRSAHRRSARRCNARRCNAHHCIAEPRGSGRRDGALGGRNGHLMFASGRADRSRAANFVADCRTALAECLTAPTSRRREVTLESEDDGSTPRNLAPGIAPPGTSGRPSRNRAADLRSRRSRNAAPRGVPQSFTEIRPDRTIEMALGCAQACMGTLRIEFACLLTRLCMVHRRSS